MFFRLKSWQRNSSSTSRFMNNRWIMQSRSFLRSGNDDNFHCHVCLSKLNICSATMWTPPLESTHWELSFEWSHSLFQTVQNLEVFLVSSNSSLAVKGLKDSVIPLSDTWHCIPGIHATGLNGNIRAEYMRNYTVSWIWTKMQWKCSLTCLSYVFWVT